MLNTTYYRKEEEESMERKASAVWFGGFKEGKGTVSASSGALSNMPYSFGSRFEGQPGTNPEELIAAAHAGCFWMALDCNSTARVFSQKALIHRQHWPWSTGGKMDHRRHSPGGQCAHSGD